MCIFATELWTKETINQQIVKPKKVNKMKKMNNIYEAPKAEVIELNVCRDLMQYVGPNPDGPANVVGGSF